MNKDSVRVFIDSYNIICQYFLYLHLGYFYSNLSKQENLSINVRDIPVRTDDQHIYTLKEDIIKRSLSDIYERRNKIDFFSYYILIDSIRGITMTMVEMLKVSEIKNLFLIHIFNNNNISCRNFQEVTKFIRNILSHNTRDGFELRVKDFERQKNRLAKKSITQIDFIFDYNCSPICINRENYIVESCIKFNGIKDGMVYTDVISEQQSLMFIELCYNCIVFLNKKFSIMP